MVHEMKNKFSVMINQRELPAENTIKDDDPGVEDPAKLECAIRNLITNLQPHDEEHASMDSDNEGSMCSIMSKKSTATRLTLVAPKLDEIRAPVEKTFMFAKNITKKETTSSRPSVPQRHSSGRNRILSPSPASSPALSSSSTRTAYLQQPSPASPTSSQSTGTSYDSTYNIYEQSTSFYSPNERLNVRTFKVLKRPLSDEINDDDDDGCGSGGDGGGSGTDSSSTKRMMLLEPIDAKLTPCMRRLGNPASSKL